MRVRSAIVAVIILLFQVCFTCGADAQDAEAVFEKGTSYLQESKWDLAIGEFKNIISVDSRHTGAQFNLGCAYALSGDYDKAIETFEQALLLEVAPFQAFCYFNIAGVYVKKAMATKDSDSYKKAAENFTKTVAILPNFLLASDYARHSQMNSSTVQLLDSITYTVDEIGLPPDSVMFLPETKIRGSGEKRICFFDAEGPPLLYFYRSPNCSWRVCESKLNVQNLSDLSEEAAACLNALLNSLKNQPATRMNKIIQWNALLLFTKAFFAKKDFDKTIEFAQRAKDLGLNYSPENVYLAWGYYNKGDHEKAKEFAKIALEANPENKAKGFLESIIAIGNQ